MRDNVLSILGLPIEHGHAENGLSYIRTDQRAANGQLTARAVAGKKIKVSTAMVFIEELSRRVSSAIYADQPNMALASVDRK
jgi:hypothetical protein